MPPRIVLFGATGYTGELTARALVRSGARPVLAGRDAGRLGGLAEELGGLDTRVADVGDPATVAALVDRGDVLVSTVGPFVRWGTPAVEAAVAAGAHYLDSTGEGTFIRRVFEEYGPRAQAAGCGLLTAMGYDWLPGNLAAGLALREAGPDARRVELAYFSPGSGAGAMSGGTRASVAAVALDPSYTLHDGRIVTERGARRVKAFELRPGRTALAVSAGSSEQFTLPHLQPHLWDVDTYLGWFGPASKPLQVVSTGTALATRIPGVRRGLDAVIRRAVKGSTGGPDAAARAKTRSLVIARVSTASGTLLSEVRLEGPNAYDLTAAFLAWGATTAAAGGLKATGALGPVEAFGLDELQAAAADAGLVRT